MTEKEVVAGGFIFAIPDEYIEKLVGVECEGAIPNGHRIVKVRADRNDMHKIGALGTVLGSHFVEAADGMPAMIAYVVEWDDLPGRLGFVIGPKVREVTDEPARVGVAH